MVEVRKGDAESATGPWMVQVLGGYGSSHFEISVVRFDFELGRQSHGQWCSAKHLISASGADTAACIHDHAIWTGLIELARRTADRLNKHADCLNCDGTGLLHGVNPCRARG